MFSLVAVLTVSNLFKSSCSFVSQDEAHKQSLVNWATNRNVGQEILNIGCIFTNSCTFSVQFLIEKFVLARSSNFLMFFLRPYEGEDELSIHLKDLL